MHVAGNNSATLRGPVGVLPELQGTVARKRLTSTSIRYDYLRYGFRVRGVGESLSPSARHREACRLFGRGDEG